MENSAEWEVWVDSLQPPYKGTEAEPVLLNLGAAVAVEFFKAETSIRYPSWKFKAGRGGDPKSREWAKGLIWKESQLWSLTLRCLEQLQAREAFPPSMPFFAPVLTPSGMGIADYGSAPTTLAWMAGLVKEHEFLLQVADHYSNPEATSGKAALAGIQQANKIAHGLEWVENPNLFEGNPFHAPVTQGFIEIGGRLAEADQEFQRKFYTPMIKQRMSVTTHLVKRGVSIFNPDGKSSRRRK
jgi:hypothetical protein